MISRTIRRVLLPVFQRVNLGDIHIRHHWTGDRFRLHSFKHKGYWWYGRAREQESMGIFARIVPPGSTVLEIGGHIGYMAQYFASLAGSEGKVFCFEPSPENLPYLRANAASSRHGNIEVIEAAAGDLDGSIPFYFESVTGQNSTILADFRQLEMNSRFNGLSSNYQTCNVEMTRIDSFLAERSVSPAFIKIDAEGGELCILQGMQKALARKPTLMVEVNTHRAEVFSILDEAGYRCFDERGHEIEASDRDMFFGNVFAIDGESKERLSDFLNP